MKEVVLLETILTHVDIEQLVKVFQGTLQKMKQKGIITTDSPNKRLVNRILVIFI